MKKIWQQMKLYVSLQRKHKYITTQLKEDTTMTHKSNTYSIVARTNGYIASRDISFNGKTVVTIEAGMTLKEAQVRLLNMFNGDYGTAYSNWGLARCNEPGNTTSHADGTRRYEYDSRYYSIEIDPF